MSSLTPREVTTYWFEPEATNEEELTANIRRWFRGGPEIDAVITRRFGAAVEEAVDGGLQDWMAAPGGRLALVILLDQMTRNLYRGRPRMYAGDARAQHIALTSFDDGTADRLGFVEQLFLSMPLLHAEDLALQDRAAALLPRFDAAAPPLYQTMMAMHREQSGKFRDVIARFGRFPHRNEVHGRQTTPEEAAFLVDWAEKGPPKGAPTAG